MFKAVRFYDDGMRDGKRNYAPHRGVMSHGRMVRKFTDVEQAYYNAGHKAGQDSLTLRDHENFFKPIIPAPQDTRASF